MASGELRGLRLSLGSCDMEAQRLVGPRQAANAGTTSFAVWLLQCDEDLAARWKAAQRENQALHQQNNILQAHAQQQQQALVQHQQQIQTLQAQV